MQIDAVITYVDGNDPVHQARMARYGDAAVFNRDDVAGRTRYANVGEIAWCVASLYRFAPFIRKIHIVTDGQTPRLEPFLQRHFPEGGIPVEIVDHKTIFRGYEAYLPVFNSVAIESMLWRIPGLSEHFLYFNDDCLLSAPVTPADFFTPDGGVVCYASKKLAVMTDLTRVWKAWMHGGQKQVTFKGMLRNALSVAGGGAWYLRYGHSPKALSRSFFETFYAAHPEALVRNIRHRFRDADQFCPEALQYIVLSRTGRCEIRPLAGKLFFFQMKDRPGYLEQKLRKLEGGGRNYMFCCFNSLDKLSEEELGRIAAWVSDRLSLRDP